MAKIRVCDRCKSIDDVNHYIIPYWYPCDFTSPKVYARRKTDLCLKCASEISLKYDWFEKK